MEGDWLMWFWLISGLILVVGEAFIPGMVAIFMGISALIMAGLHFIGLVDSVSSSFLIFMALSIVNVLVFKGLVHKYFPANESSANIDEDVANFGKVVAVLETITEEGRQGQIRYQGVLWSAQCLEGTLLKGQNAKLLYRDNLTWIVEAADDSLLLDSENLQTVPENLQKSIKNLQKQS